MTFSARLHQGVQSTKNSQTFTGQVFRPVLQSQLLTHQRKVSGIVGCTSAGAVPGIQRSLRRAGSDLRCHGTCFAHQRQYQLATRLCSGRPFHRIVVSRPANQGDQQGDLMQFQFRQRSAEIELTGEAETVYCTLAILAEVDLVDVGIENIGFAVMQLQYQRHQCFAQLSR